MCPSGAASLLLALHECVHGVVVITLGVAMQLGTEAACMPMFGTTGASMHFVHSLREGKQWSADCGCGVGVCSMPMPPVSNVCAPAAPTTAAAAAARFLQCGIQWLTPASAGHACLCQGHRLALGGDTDNWGVTPTAKEGASV